MARGKCIQDIDARFDLWTEQYYTVKLRIPGEVTFTNKNRTLKNICHSNLYDEIMDYLQGNYTPDYS